MKSPGTSSGKDSVIFFFSSHFVAAPFSCAHAKIMQHGMRVGVQAISRMSPDCLFLGLGR